MGFKFFGSVAVVTALLLSGCANQSSLSPQATQIMNDYSLESVNFNDVYKARGDGTRAGSKALLVDVRSAEEYEKGTISSSLNFPAGKDIDFKSLEKTPKDRKVVLFGLNASQLEVFQMAGLFKEHGFSNVKVYLGGVEDWAKNNYLEIGVEVASKAFKNNSALFIDARPLPKFLAETIPGSLSIPDTDIKKLEGRFPVDKSTPIIAYCAGYDCHKSNVVGDELYKRGYTNISVFIAGIPAWKAAGLPTTACKKDAPKVNTSEANAKFIDGVKLGVDEGSVDGEWLKALINNGKVPSNVVIVDVRKKELYDKGHIKGAINIAADSVSAKTLPKDKVVILQCMSGSTAMDTRMKLDENKADISKIFYFDANVKCEGNDCKIDVNEPLN